MKLIRCNLLSADTGDVLFEHVWAPINSKSENPKSEAVASMLQVFFQLSKEVDGEANDIPCIKFNAKSEGPHKMQQDTASSIHSSYRNKQRNTSEQAVILKEKKRGNFIGALFYIGDTEDSSERCDKILEEFIETFRDRFASQVSLLPTTPKDRRETDEEQKYIDFRAAIYDDFLKSISPSSQ